MDSSLPVQLASGPNAIVPIELVDIRAELETRQRRVSDIAQENRGFVSLGAEMATNPRNMLQRLVELAVELCDAHTAGISLLDGEVFRWEAVAGVFAAAKGGTMPRHQSPCGVCIDRQTTQLMHLADRCFPALMAEPRFVEALLIPFYENGKAIGTVWIVSHNDARKFDKEDERVVTALAQFAAAGWQLLRGSESNARANGLKDDFLATLGHELRNPLGAIVAAVNVLRTRVEADDIATTAADIVLRQAKQISKLADDLLDIARIENGKVDLDLQPTDLRTIVADAIAANRQRIDARKHSLSVDLGADAVLVRADSIRIAQVISNLLDNALKYTPEAGSISVSLATQGDDVLVTVRDTGIGIPPAALQQIFEPFMQLRGAQSSGGGLGLGLALVKRLTELHNGGVNVASAG
jgi:signal transduction histidine kinase